MPELSDVTFSKIVVIKLISCSLKISRSAINITRIKTSSIVVIAATYFLSLFFLSIIFSSCISPSFLSFFSNLNRQNAGTVTITNTTANIRNNGIINFVPASSPSFFAIFFRSSKASCASLCNRFFSPLVPFLKF